MPLSEADLNVIVETFEPPPAAGGGGGGRAAPPPALPGRPAPAYHDALVSYDEFTLAVRGPPMEGGRVAFVRAAHAALKDDAAKKDVKPHHLAGRYDVSAHPAVTEGLLTEEEAAMAFLYPWREEPSALDDEVSLKEFADRYEWLSPLYASDEAFEAMMRAVWKLK